MNRIGGKNYFWKDDKNNLSFVQTMIFIMLKNCCFNLIHRTKWTAGLYIFHFNPPPWGENKNCKMGKMKKGEKEGKKEEKKEKQKKKKRRKRRKKGEKEEKEGEKEEKRGKKGK